MVLTGIALTKRIRGYYGRGQAFVDGRMVTRGAEVRYKGRYYLHY